MIGGIAQETALAFLWLAVVWFGVACLVVTAWCCAKQAVINAERRRIRRARAAHRQRVLAAMRGAA